MDVSSPPFHSSSNWYVHWALWVGSFWKCQRQGHPGKLPRCGGGAPRAAFAPNGQPLLASPPPLVLPAGPSSVALLSGDDFYLELLWGEGGISLRLPSQLHCLLPVSLCVSLSLPSLRLWIGPKKLQKCNESGNLRSG